MADKELLGGGGDRVIIGLVWALMALPAPKMVAMIHEMYFCVPLELIVPS